MTTTERRGSPRTKDWRVLLLVGHKLPSLCGDLGAVVLNEQNRELVGLEVDLEASYLPFPLQLILHQ